MKTLAIDLSTACTGWALFRDEKLKNHGYVKPKVKGISKMRYPEAPLRRIESITEQLTELIRNLKPDRIVIEEINPRGNGRLGQKTLDAAHFFLLQEAEKLLPLGFKSIFYMDTQGPKGWRTELNLLLSEEDKKFNRKVRYDAKKDKLKKSEIEVVTHKRVAVRHVNDKYRVGFSDELTPPDEQADMADAICLGEAFLSKLARKK